MQNDETNKTYLYFEKYRDGMKLKDIAQHFGRSINTIKKYLEDHPDYRPRGRGNKISKANGRVLPKNTGKSINKNTKQVTFYCNQQLLDRLDLINSIDTRKAKYIAAIEDYLKLNCRDRPKANLSSTVKDRLVKFNCPNKLLTRLDRNYKSEANKTRTDKIIAAIELFCKNHEVHHNGEKLDIRMNR